jgi:hypothetical protein
LQNGGQVDAVKFRAKPAHLDSASNSHNDFATVTFSMDYAGNFVVTIHIQYHLSGGAVSLDFIFQFIQPAF